jgi:hypothetical protein
MPTTSDLEFWNFVSDPPAPRFGTPPGTELAAAAAGHRILVRDSGDDLCVDIDRLDLDGADCFAPPVNSHFTSIFVDPGQGIVAGIFAAPVSTVDVGFRGGGSMRIPASEGTGYSGRWRSAVHFALAPIPAGRTVDDALLLDSGGRQIGVASVDGPGDEDTLIGPARTALQVGAGAAAARVVVGAKRSPLSPRLFPCFSLVLGQGRGDCDDSASAGQSLVTAVVPCDMRRTIVYGVVPGTAPRVQIGLSNGRTVEARMAPYPSGLGTHAKVFLAVLPRDVAVARVRFAGQRREGVSDTVKLPTRAPERQCGYEATRTVN